MNKTAISLIIGIMTLALVGSMYLQASWIYDSIKINEEQFGKNVFAALNAVAMRLENEETKEAYNTMNGFSTTYVEEIIRQGEQGVSVDLSYKEFSLGGTKANECTCPNCVSENFLKFTQLMGINEERHNLPLEERIFNLEMLSAFVKRELASRGIGLEYFYGVHSNHLKSLIIANDHYVVADRSPQVIQTGHKNLLTSQYQVELFRQDLHSPGQLIVYFPNKLDYVWGKVWKNLLAALFFTSLIVLCFGYTIYVIFRQKKLSEMKGDFINNMTHEFKTPIATISLAADSITNPSIAGKPEKVKRFADIIRQENRRMNSQVEKVLQMALIDKKDFDLKTTPVDLHQVIQNAVGNFALQVEKRDGILTTNLKAEKTNIEGDVTHITNIIHNLMDNANKYSPEKPEITIHTRNLRNGIEVTVEDKGMGMGREALKNIFDKFYRVHTGNLHDVKGFGLGLSYVKAIITAHKGQIDVKSDLGKGSKFILFFPFKMEE